MSEEQTIGRKHPFTILVLSGGGARGIAHIGVLKVLEELHIPVDMVVGTSMGAIVGGLYAAGLSPSEIEKKMLEVDWDDIFSDNPKPMQQPYRLRKDLSKYMQGVEIGYAVDQIQIPQGMIAGQKLRIALNNILLPVLSVDDFDRLPLPFRAVATDLVTGERVNLSSGSLTKAIMASMSIPGIFAPVEIDNRILVDGGVVANLAIETARELGAERIIAVDVSSQLLSKDELKNLVDVTKQVLAIYGRRNHLYQLSLLKKDDILLSLKLEGLSNTDFKKAKEIIREGESAAIEKKELLASASVSEEEYRQIKSYVSARNRKEPVIVDFIEILPPKKVSPLIVEKRIKTAVGKKLDLDTLEQDITNIYATGLFERVDYQITRMDENYGLKIEPITKPWGPNYLYLGLQFDSTRDFNPLLRYRMTQMNLRGGELNIYLKMGIDHIIEAEFYQPIDYGDHFFIAPSFSYHQRNTDLYKDDDRYARYRTRTTSTGLYGGVNIGNEGQFRAGIEGENLTSEPSIGDITLPEYEDNLFLLNSSFVIDHLDNLLFPESGWYFSADYSTPFPGLEEQEFHKLLLKGLGAWSNKHNTILAYLEAGSSFDTELPLYRSFTLGGFQRISGLNLDELIGNYEGLFRITYIRSFAKTLPFSITGYFIGSSIETGNVWEEVDNISLEDMKLSGSIFSGVKTPLGPVYIGYGIRSLEKGIFYFYLGPVF